MNNQIGNFYFLGGNKSLLYDFENNVIYSFTSNSDLNMLYEALVVVAEEGGGVEMEDLLNRRFPRIMESFIREKVSVDSFIELSEITSTKLSLMIIQDCNLRCTYCYGGDGSYGSGGKKMTKEVASAAIDFMVRRNMETDNYLVTFFGGEPLMNFKLIKYIVRYCHEKYPEKSFYYSLTTNGVLLDSKKISFFEDNNVSIMVSIDGPQEVHDRNRPKINGKGSHQDVLRGISRLQKSNVDFDHVRITTLEEDYDSSNIINYVETLGVKNIAVSPALNYTDDDKNFPISIDLLKKGFESRRPYIDNIKNKILQGDYPIYIPFLVTLTRIHKAKKSTISCGIFNGSLTVSFDGELFPCHRYVGMVGSSVGNVFDGLDDTSVHKLSNSWDDATSDCDRCFAKYICKRACPRNISKNNGKFISFDSEYCELMREHVSEIIEFYFELKEKRPQFLEKL